MGGLGEVGGAAEVAPVVLVGTEGDDFFALGGEAEVGGDDGKDALFGEHREEAGGDEVDAGESEGVGISGGSNNFWFLIRADAAAAKLEVIVEQERAGSFAGLHGEGGEGVIFGVELEHAGEINVADDVDVVEKEGLVEASGIFEEKPGSLFQASSGVEQDFFTGDFDAKAEILVGFQVGDDHVGEVVDVDDGFGDAKSAQVGKGDFEEGAAGEFDESFGTRVG